MDIREELFKRRIVGLREITRSSIESIRADLLRLSLASREEIWLAIDSDGGNCIHALFLCDFIEQIAAPVTGLVVGRCYSMATVIFQACQKRIALPNARLFLHYVSVEPKISLSRSDEEIRAYIDRQIVEGRGAQARCEKLVAKRAGKSGAEVQRLMREGDILDVYLSAQEALGFGLIDEISEISQGSTKLIQSWVAREAE